MPPKKGESKQDFLGRCSKEKREAGLAEDKALKDCTSEWKQSGRLSAYVDEGRMHLSAPVEFQLAAQAAEGEAQDPDRFSILAHTGKVIDWGFWGRFVIVLKGMKLAKDKVPCLYGHQSSAIVGTIDKSSTDANGFYVFGQFSQVPTSRGPEVLAHAREGFPWQASIGVYPDPGKIKTLAKGEKMTVNNQTVEGPCEVWLESTVFETSFVPFGADDDTAAVAMSASGKTISPEDDTMPQTATDDPKHLAGQPSQAGQPANTDPGSGAPAQPDAAALAAQARKDAAADAAALLAHGKTLNLSMDEVQGVLVLGLPKDQATEKMLQLAASKNPPVGAGGRIDMGTDEHDKLRLAASHGITLAIGGKVEKPAPGHERFRGLSLVEIGRECLRLANINPEGMTASQVARKVIGLSAGPMGTSDFQAISMDVINKRLLDAYNEAPATWRRWVSIVSATDYKEIHGVALSEAPDLQLVKPGGEYKTGTLKDKSESYRMAKYGIIIPITEEAIINDDRGAFTRLPQLAGFSASRNISAMVYGLLASNPKMNEDGKALFHTDHKNLASGTGNVGGITSAILSYMRKLQRNQKGPKGAVLNVPSRYILLPTKYETEADILLRSMALPESGMSSAVANPWAGKLEPVVDAWLDHFDEDAWYTAADPNLMPTMEVAFLDGNEQPILTEDDEFRRDMISLKVKQVAGAGLVDFRGLQKNPGK